ncbi:hypothetical protein [Nocardia wallacei]|uniref:hypothetical protein n=1 Tax=Nocardia wallacei TaxID=480035 RepID=UPI002456EA6F|nr:hypothetical protein [Nocardia wallacei]
MPVKYRSPAAGTARRKDAPGAGRSRSSPLPFPELMVAAVAERAKLVLYMDRGCELITQMTGRAVARVRMA